MRILVTGGAGFIGRPALRRLLESTADHVVLAIGRSGATPVAHDRLRWLQANLNEPATYAQAVRDFRPEVVVHLAWEGIPDFSITQSLANLTAGVRLFDLVLGLGSCRKAVVAGTCFEYNQLEGACSEKNPGQPKDAFTWAKHALRGYLAIRCAGQDVVLAWLRLFYVYGPGQRSGSLIPTVLGHLRRGELPDLKTPKNANDFIYVDDVAEAFLRAVESDIASGIFNIGSGHSTPVLEMCRLAEQTARGSEQLAHALEAATRESRTSVNFWADDAATRSLLSWQPRVNEGEGIARTWRHLASS